ncbi:hypothetical protein SKAU_G00067210 [Synaphobranchus kaupii]|uniref:Uncharacterized protein n=1 Tax=Synaphobranchus kaupii TaxID=118154 RepID=A0A9Q1JA70_SYNKA|nr:hypothetical protein SKAU_G00067210 [Synaphobranchus kaupii]
MSQGQLSSITLHNWVLMAELAKELTECARETAACDELSAVGDVTGGEARASHNRVDSELELRKRGQSESRADHRGQYLSKHKRNIRKEAVKKPHRANIIDLAASTPDNSEFTINMSTTVCCQKNLVIMCDLAFPFPSTVTNIGPSSDIILLLGSK